MRLVTPTSAPAVEQDELTARQNPDGGWSYDKGGSWTEPTCYAILALRCQGSTSPAIERGISWLRLARNGDGGWPVRKGVAESAWVTSLAVLALPAGAAAATERNQGVRWLMQASGRTQSTLTKVRQRLLGVKSDYPEDMVAGWPWVSNTAAWNAPTALALLALRKAVRLEASAEVAARLDRARRFLLDRVCRDGGWNYGPPSTLAVDAPSYPETTGVTLLALAGSRDARLPAAISAAERHLAACRSAEAARWLEMALTAQGRPPAEMKALPERTTVAVTLRMLATAAVSSGRPFLVSDDV